MNVADLNVPNVANLLRYGAMGLGLALAVLTYFLLRAEQTVPRPRKAIITAIYTFMALSLALSAIGFTSEYLRSRSAQELSNSREVLRTLMKLKGGKIERLKQLDPDKPSYTALVEEIRIDLAQIDENIRKALKALD